MLKKNSLQNCFSEKTQERHSRGSIAAGVRVPARPRRRTTLPDPRWQSRLPMHTAILALTVPSPRLVPILDTVEGFACLARLALLRRLEYVGLELDAAQPRREEPGLGLKKRTPDVCWLRVHVNVNKKRKRKKEDTRGEEPGLGLHTILPVPILYGVWHETGGSVGGRILRNGRAMVLQ